jgi:hypothetical protein
MYSYAKEAQVPKSNDTNFTLISFIFKKNNFRDVPKTLNSDY